ncbi:putative receptor protein kinase TMK1 [Acorus calamus]|uniref:Receptor protein kinase TMK1 n=1 Tax=Acorus calamus TaxID=4465 RepID=A0AAV9DYP0_ACOCL|nr:putative receptor protein kinase TMK1 [Acorus calamus]
MAAFLHPLLLTFLLLITTTTSADLPPSESAAMTKLSSSLSPPDWSGPDPCAWKGVSCSGGHVASITLSGLNIKGILPPDLDSLTSLTSLSLQDNLLSGELPPLPSLSSLSSVFLDNNLFSRIPATFFSGLSGLQTFSIEDNPSLAPWEFPDLSGSGSLVSFKAMNSSMAGTIPDVFASVPGLQLLRLSYNNLLGSLPPSFAGSGIKYLYLNSLSLSGGIDVLASMTNLVAVSFQANRFTGPVPDLSNLTSLETLNLRDNQLTGVLPPLLFKIPALKNASFVNNVFQGPFPVIPDGVKVELSNGSFCLPTPGDCDPRVDVLLEVAAGFGYPMSLARLWTGNDPCKPVTWPFLTCNANGAITVLSLASQHLTGFISPAIANLTALKTVILSSNNLTGLIPDSMTGLPQLQMLDVSNNNITGFMPSFRPGVTVKVTGNPLFGKAPGSGGGGSGSDSGSSGPSPGESNSKNSQSKNVIGGIVGGVIGVVILVGGSYCFWCKYRNDDKKPNHKKFGRVQTVGPQNEMVKIGIHNLAGPEIPGITTEGPFISIDKLRKATGNFNEENELGRGGFGIVYKGVLENGTEVAVKRMESNGMGMKGMNEFKAEIEVLNKVRHRHLVSVIGYCIDGNENLLVYELMHNGTLGQHLFEWQERGEEPLSWKRRLIIALDVARGVEYLHSLAQSSFIHRDLKPSNILLGKDWRAKVSDFGLVKSAPSGNHSLETRLAGTFGYLAPEYATTGKVTTKVDVYAYGVILMELIIGRRALDDSLPVEEAHLVSWFRRAFSHKDSSFSKYIDPTLQLSEDEKKCAIIVAELATHCTVRDPYQRPEMGHAVNVLSSLVEQWKPASPSEDDDDLGMQSNLNLAQVVQEWERDEGTSTMNYGLFRNNESNQTTQSDIFPVQTTGAVVPPR